MKARYAPFTCLAISSTLIYCSCKSVSLANDYFAIRWVGRVALPTLLPSSTILKYLLHKRLSLVFGHRASALGC